MSLANTPTIGFKQDPELRSRTFEVVQEAFQKRGLTAETPVVPGLGDQTRLSDELLDEISGKQELNPNADVESLVKALQGMLEPRMDQQPQPDPNAGGGVGQVSEGKSKPKKERSATWTPDTHDGQILPGRDVIGKVEVKERTVNQPGEGQAGQNASRQNAQQPRQV
ncbi:MAG: hypothetical protein AB1758_31415, partial [Candidatus Eremiobacterota bacterium]